MYVCTYMISAREDQHVLHVKWKGQNECTMRKGGVCVCVCYAQIQCKSMSLCTKSKDRN